MLTPVMPMLDAHGANLLLLELLAEPWLKLRLFHLLSSLVTRSLRRSQSNSRKNAHTLMLAPVMPMLDAHGANLLLLELLAEPWIRLRLSHPLSSLVTRSLRRFQFN